jgi:hypothetical protein
MITDECSYRGQERDAGRGHVPINQFLLLARRTATWFLGRGVHCPPTSRRTAANIVILEYNSNTAFKNAWVTSC